MSSELEDQIAAIREFNRFYTRKLGIIEPKLLHSAWSLQEARLIYEIGQRQTCTATDLVRALGLDAGYVSRTLQMLQRRQIVSRKPLKTDRRATEISLTAKGRAAFTELDGKSRDEVGKLLDLLDEADRAAVVQAMAKIEQTLEPAPEPPLSYRLRNHRPGDIGWVIARHGAVYTKEYGWDSSFEALVAEIGAQFLRNYEPARESCWIAEANGEPVGSVFLVKGSARVAKLRLLLVEREARGLGVGRALVDECIRFAKQTGYKSISLWTQSNLVAARGIYQRAGFQCTKQEKHHSFGADLIGETWQRDL
ncbi:MAG TPA: helix-turn-helix domain-containing GNAT family N-acetyltransferase [Xanthobacteraceae bacterium]|jgi:DNA-binding MarR family transcriptional regulator/GNAT superfamily N-acetyltransferase